jgi:hypothetical protein
MKLYAIGWWLSRVKSQDSATADCTFCFAVMG